MTGTEMKHVVVSVLIAVVVLFGVYQLDPTMFGLMSREGFAGAAAGAAGAATPATPAAPAAPKKDEKAGTKQGFANKDEHKDHFEDKKEGFADVSGYEGPAQFSSAQPPAGCYPRDQLTPSELLPKDMNSVWAEQNPMGPGSLKGKNFLSAGALIGVNTVGQSMRNANLQVRSEPPNPQVAVSIFNQSTISPDISHRPLEIGA
jgi:hypothetical protein